MFKSPKVESVYCHLFNSFVRAGDNKHAEFLKPDSCASYKCITYKATHWLGKLELMHDGINAQVFDCQNANQQKLQSCPARAIKVPTCYTQSNNMKMLLLSVGRSFHLRRFAVQDFQAMTRISLILAGLSCLPLYQQQDAHAPPHVLLQWYPSEQLYLARTLNPV